MLLPLPLTLVRPAPLPLLLQPPLQPLLMAPPLLSSLLSDAARARPATAEHEACSAAPPQPLAAASPCFAEARARARRDRRICGLTAPVAVPVSCSSSAASAAANTAAAGDVASRPVLMRRGLRPRRQR